MWWSQQYIRKRHHPSLVLYSLISSADFPLQTVWNTLSQSVCPSAQMLRFLTVRWRFMSQGASGPRGYHITRMMALLSWVPSQKTRRAGAGRWVTGIQNMLHRTKDISLVVLGWMSCRFGEKQVRAFHFASIGDRLNITQAVCGYPGDGQWRPLMWLPSDRADGGADVRVALKPSDKEADTSCFKVVRWVMFSELIMRRLLV